MLSAELNEEGNIGVKRVGGWRRHYFENIQSIFINLYIYVHGPYLLQEPHTVSDISTSASPSAPYLGHFCTTYQAMK